MPTDPAKLLELFQQSIREGIPDVLPLARPLDPSVSHTPTRNSTVWHNECVHTRNPSCVAQFPPATMVFTKVFLTYP